MFSSLVGEPMSPAVKDRQLERLAAAAYRVIR